jgi:hypothetical protein
MSDLWPPFLHDEIETAMKDVGRWVLTPELIHSLVRAHERYLAGEITTGEAAIEQMEAFLAVNSVPALKRLIDALKLYLKGDEAPLQALLGSPPTPKFMALQAKRRVKRGRRT